MAKGKLAFCKGHGGTLPKEAGEGARAEVKGSDLWHTVKSPKINQVTEKLHCAQSVLCL